MMSLGESLKRAAREAAWAPAAVLVLHAAAGHLFGHEPYVDPMAHLLGGAAVAFFVRRACSIARERLGAPSPLALDLLALGLACTAALLWESGEFLSDLYMGTQAQASLAETLRDLVMGAGGALAYLSLARMVRRPGGKNRLGWGFLLLLLVIAGVLVLTSEDVDFTGAMSERPAIACDLNVLAPAERGRRAGLAERLERSIVAVRELPTGYALSVDGERLPLEDLKAFVELEGRCCSFLHFEITPGPGRFTVLTVTGGEGVKEFLATVPGLGER